MITPSPQSLQPEDWQKQQAQAISDPRQLLQLLELPTSLLGGAQRAAQTFPLRVTRHFLGLMEKGNPHDPLLRQVLPLGEELLAHPDYLDDPVGDAAAALGNGILHKYHGRALLITTGACGVHCRYCFRRNYPYAEDNATRHWQGMLDQLAEMPQIDEVILSGGDPLTLSDRRLAELLERLQAMPQLQRLRIHSRQPVVLPARITPQLTQMLGDCRLHTSLVLHCNHPAELAPELQTGLERLRAAGVTLLNQSVLLKGVNDDPETLAKLSETLFGFGVLPYYLHQLDRVSGAQHFAVGDRQAHALHETLRKRLPGYLLPRLVREIAGEASKTPLAET